MSLPSVGFQYYITRESFQSFALNSKRLATPFKETKCLSRNKGKGPTITWFLLHSVNAVLDRSLHTDMHSFNRPDGVIYGN